MENLGIVLLMGFYFTCLIGFVSVLGYMIVTNVHSYVMEKIEKIRTNYIR